MKYWTGLCGLLTAVSCGLGGLFHEPGDFHSGEFRGTAFVTQAGPTASNAHEYDVSFGESWQSVRIFRLLDQLDKPLKVYIETHPQNQALYKQNYRNYVAESLKVWDEALDGRMKYTYTTNPKEADISIHWVSSFDDRYVAGLTTYRVGHATIEIKTISVPEADIKGNIIHEFGHALGISGHSNNPDDIMVGMRKWHRDNVPYNPKLSQRDVQAIKRLYSRDWKKGEDLYAVAAQRAVIEPLASVKQTNQSITLQPMDDTELIRWREAQTREAKQFRFTQIFPTK